MARIRATVQAPDHTWPREFKASIALGWPLILTNLAQTALVTTDIIFLGRLGADTLAAGALSASLYQIFMIFCIGLVSATIPILATAMGRRRFAVREVRRTLQQGLWSAVLVCIPVWAVLWQSEAILVALGQNPELAARSVEFMRTLQWALLPYLGYIVLRSLLAAMERPLWALFIAACAIVFNALIGWCLILGHWGLPALGLAGAGIASTCSSTLMFLSLAVVLVRNPSFRRYRLFGYAWRTDWKRLAEIWRLGMPIAITFTLESLVFYAAIMLMGIIGDTALAAHAIAMQIATITFMIPLGFGQVATVRVGLAWGRGDTAGVARSGWAAYILGVGFMGVAALLMWLAPKALIGLFIDTRQAENNEVVELAIRFLAFAALFQIADGAQAVASGMLRGLHDTRAPMLLAAIGYWLLGMPIGTFLAFVADLKGIGIWIGLATGLSIVAVLLTWRWRKRSKLKRYD